jgi:hypothetical protein
MKLIIRVAITIFFSAFALWAQTPGSNMFVLRASEPESLKAFASMPSDQWLGSKTGDQFSFKLDSPQPFPDDKNLVLASSAPVLPRSTSASSQAPTTSPKAFSYSNGYYTRRKIHKYASIATLPLVVSEAIVGQKLLDNRNDDSLRSAHSALASGIAVLFGIESVTGAWNMWEARKNPNGRGKRMFHGILMLAADAGFVATAVTAPHHEDDDQGLSHDSASTHKAVAYASFGVATISYLYMLFTR